MNKPYAFIEPNLRTQAGRIIAKFGGAPALTRALKEAGYSRHETSVYRWDKFKWEGGTGGLIPANIIPEVNHAARLAGIILTDKDWSPVERDDATQREQNEAANAKRPVVYKPKKYKTKAKRKAKA